jgi:hypothetical protein
MCKRQSRNIGCSELGVCRLQGRKENAKVYCGARGMQALIAGAESPQVGARDDNRNVVVEGRIAGRLRYLNREGEVHGCEELGPGPAWDWQAVRLRSRPGCSAGGSASSRAGQGRWWILDRASVRRLAPTLRLALKICVARPSLLLALLSLSSPCNSRLLRPPSRPAPPRPRCCPPARPRRHGAYRPAGPPTPPQTPNAASHPSSSSTGLAYIWHGAPTAELLPSRAKHAGPISLRLSQGALHDVLLAATGAQDQPQIRRRST